MGKSIFLSIAMAFSISAVAQVQVDSLNRLVVGASFHPEGGPAILPIDSTLNVTTSGAIVKPVFPPEETAVLDNKARLCVLGPDCYFTGGYITFGNGKDVWVGEKSIPRNYGFTPLEASYLELGAKTGINFMTQNGVVAGFSTSRNRFTFNTDVQVDGVFVNSDSRLKSDVNDITDLASALSSIIPVSYRLTRGGGDAAMAQSENDSVSDIALPADNRERFGFIAQEVKKVFPQLVAEDENGYLSVDYIGFVPILVEAVNSLSEKVEAQDEVIASLLNERRNAPTAGVEGIAEVKLCMSQNKPNPFSQSTVIEVTVPENVSQASIIVYDLQGKQIQRHDIDGRGKTAVTIAGSSLQPGMYIYTLIADGEEVATKRMILTD